mgnify:CR=1 FL=1|tara:strand:- start:252 stop:1580 length:1329 start_codon:yes stop_codon:yes gene_type:complete
MQKPADSSETKPPVGVEVAAKTAHEDRAPGIPGWWIVALIAGTGLYFLANVQRVAVPGAIFGTLQRELNASASSITWLGASFMYVYALSQLVIGFMVENFGGRRVIFYGALVFCVGAVLFSLSHGLPLLYASRMMVGLGASSLYLSLVQEARRIFQPKDFPVALSSVIFTGYAGGIVAGAPFVIAANGIGWRNLMLLLGLAAILGWLVFSLACGMKQVARGSKPRNPFRLRPYLEILRLPNNRSIYACTGLHFGIYYVLQTVVGKKYLEDFLGLTSENAAWVLSLMAILAALSGFVPVFLGKLIGGRIKIFIIGSGCMSTFVCCGLVLMTGFNVQTPAVAVFLCMLAVTASLSPIAIPLLYGTNEPSKAGLAVCLFNFSLYFFVALLGNAVGLLMNCFDSERGGPLHAYGKDAWLAIFSLLACLACVVLVLSVRLKENKVDR